MQLFEQGDSGQHLAHAKEIYSQYLLLNDLVTLRISFEKVLEQVSLLPDSASLPLFEASSQLKEALSESQKEAKDLHRTVTALINKVRDMEASTVALQSDAIKFSRLPRDSAADATADTDTFLDKMICFLEEINVGISLADHTSNLSVISQSLKGQINYLLQDRERYARRIHKNVRGIVPIGIATPYDHFAANTVGTDNAINGSFDKGGNMYIQSEESEYSDDGRGATTESNKQELQQPVTHLDEHNIALLEGEDKLNGPKRQVVLTLGKRAPPALWHGCFCDSDFLTALCNDVMQSGGASNPMAIMEQLKRLQAKKVNTRARRDHIINKDRAVNTQKIHKKLENFISPVRRPDRKYLKMVRGSLFK